MNAANLTRGGFYAHFKSKDALIESILNRDAGLVRMMSDRPGKNKQALNQEALDILSDYLDTENLDTITERCPLATMPVDASRSADSIREAYSKRFHTLIDQLQRGLGKKSVNANAARVLAVLAVGGVLFARASATEKEAQAIEKACLGHIQKLL